MAKTSRKTANRAKAKSQRARSSRSAVSSGAKTFSPSPPEANANGNGNGHANSNGTNSSLTVSKGEYVRLAGRSYKVVADHGNRFGFPLNGRTVDLEKVIQRLHQFLVDNRLLFMADEESRMLQQATGLTKERYLEQRIKALQLSNESANLDLMAKAGALVEVELLRQCLSKYSAAYRRAGEQLQKRFGNDALMIVDQAISEAQRAVEVILGSDDGTDE